MPRHAKSKKAARKRKLEADLRELVARARAYLESRFGQTEPQLKKLGLKARPAARPDAKPAPARAKAPKRAARKARPKAAKKPRSRAPGAPRPRRAPSKRRARRPRRGQR